MNPKTIITIVFALIVVAGGVWLYFYSTDPLNLTCAKVNADPQGAGVRAGDAVYDALPPAAKSRTNQMATRVYIITECETGATDQTMSEIRDRLAQNANAPH